MAIREKKLGMRKKKEAGDENNVKKGEKEKGGAETSPQR